MDTTKAGSKTNHSQACKDKMTDQDISNEVTAAPGLTPKRLRYLLANDLFSMIPEVGEDMVGRPTDNEPTIGFIARMLSGPTPEEGITSAAHALQPAQAVSWGLECLQILFETLSPEDQQLLQLTNNWLSSGNEDSREEVLQAAMDADVKTPGVWLAFGAVCSDESAHPPEQQETPIPEFLTGRAINAGVLSALARVGNGERNQRIAEFVSLAKVFATSP